MEQESGPELVLQGAGTQLAAEDRPDFIRQFQVNASMLLGVHQTFLRKLSDYNVNIMNNSLGILLKISTFVNLH